MDIDRSYYDIPKFIRRNARYFILFKGIEGREIRQICSDHGCSELFGRYFIETNTQTARLLWPVSGLHAAKVSVRVRHPQKGRECICRSARLRLESGCWGNATVMPYTCRSHAACIKMKTLVYYNTYTCVHVHKVCVCITALIASISTCTLWEFLGPAENHQQLTCKNIQNYGKWIHNFCMCTKGEINELWTRKLNTQTTFIEFYLQTFQQNKLHRKRLDVKKLTFMSLCCSFIQWTI